MATGTPERFTIDELSNAVQQALAEGYQGATNGQVRSIPDLRTIRYYTTLGLIDRPAEMRGRTALYGRRHLLQLVAIKRLQAEGHSLEEIQGRLAGANDQVLKKIANLGPMAPTTGAPTPAAAAQGSSRRAAAFWSAVPTETPPRARPLASRQEPTIEASPTPLLTAVPLEGAVHLLFPIHRPLGEDDLSAIRTAAAPLLALLANRGLIASTAAKEND